MPDDPLAGEPFPAARFRVSWDGRAVPGVVAVAGLGWALSEGRDGSLLAQPDRLRVERDRGADDAFEAWAELTRRAAAGGRQKLRERAAKDVIVELSGPGRPRGPAWLLRECLPVAYSPVERLDAVGAATVREVLVLEAEGIERLQVPSPRAPE